MPSKRLKQTPLNEDIFKSETELLIERITNRPWMQWTIQLLYVISVIMLISAFVVLFG